MVEFVPVCKLHGAVAVVLGLIFLIATFGWSFPWIGPEALLVGWDTSNEALMFMSRTACALLFGVGYFEFVMPDHEKAKDIFVRYHVILVLLVAYSTVGAATYWFSWFYTVVLGLFLVTGFMGTTGGYSSV